MRVVSASEQGQGLHIVLRPSLDIDRGDLSWHLRSFIILDHALHVGLSVTEERRHAPIRERQLDRVDAHSDTSLYFRQHLLRELFIAVHTVVLAGSQLGELEVAATSGSINCQACHWGLSSADRGMNAKVLERTQARVERDIFLGLASHSNDFLQFLGGKLSRLALNAGESPHCIRYMLKLRLEFGVQCLDTILHRLVQLLEALIDLRSQSLNTILYRLILLYLVLIELRG